MLTMNSRDLREEIYKMAQENPALEIVSDPLENSSDGDFVENHSSITSDEYQAALESTEDNGETLQQHLMEQLNFMNISKDEYDVCQQLIYNLDKNGFYGSMRNPETLLDKSRPLQNKLMLEKCLDYIHNMDPVGVCCKSPEESLYVQAKINGDASKLTLFILDGNLEFLNPPDADKCLKKIEKYVSEYSKKAFGKPLPISAADLNFDEVEDSINYILSLNPNPASGYACDSSHIDIQRPDVVLKITRENGSIDGDDFSKGLVLLNNRTYFQVKYASGVLPEIRIADNKGFDKNLVDQAKAFKENLEFRQNTIILQGCEIVRNQLDFFDKGPGYLHVLTRRKVAEAIKVHESTVSRTSAKHNSKYFDTEWGTLPASYFFVSGVSGSDGQQKISADEIKVKIEAILKESANPVSDSELCNILNEMGIKIARRTVAKYRQQAGIKNSYDRKSKDK